MAAEGVTPLVDVLQLSRRDAQFLLQVSRLTLPSAICLLSSSRNSTTIPREPFRNILKIPTYSSKRSVTFLQSFVTRPYAMQQPTRGWEEPPPYHSTDIPGQAHSLLPNLA
jgi:hypothetical protein